MCWQYNHVNPIATKSIQHHWVMTRCIGIDNEKSPLILVLSFVCNIRPQYLMDPSGKYISVDESSFITIDKPMTVIHMHSRILLTQNHPMNKQPQTNNLYSTVSARTAHPLGNLETSSTEDRDSDGDWSLPSIPLPRKQHGCLVHLSDRLLPYNTLVTC